jgi:2-dehydro-3-deoxyglucarate aldolase
MNGPSLKSRLRSGQLTIGSWLSFGFPPLCEIMAAAGFDWLVVDMEHTAIGVAEAHQLIQVISLAGVVPLVRVPVNDPVPVKQVLDAGSHGVLVPQVNDLAAAKRAARSVYYPPRGERGAGLARAQRYGLGFGAYRDWAEKESILIVQIEHVRAVEHLEAMLALEEVDGFIVGPYDLSASAGAPGDWEHPDVAAALSEISRIVRSGTKPGGFHVVHSDHGELQRRIDEGYTFIAYGDDMVFIAEKVRDEAAFADSLRKDNA